MGVWRCSNGVSLEPVGELRPAGEVHADAAYSSAVGSECERAEVQRDIDQHLKQLAERHLAPGRSLEIEVLDVDLAGRFEPFRFRSGADVRIVRNVTWPRMRMRYALTDGGQVTSSSEELVADLNYLMSINRYSSGDRLRYEKAMLDDWFERRISKR